MAILTDGVTAAVERALDGVSQRQRVTADNIANVNTPNYRAKKVDFEDSLRRAASQGDAANASIGIADAGTTANAQGNRVDMGTARVAMVKSGLQYDALVAALNYKLGLLRSALGAGR